MDINVAAQIAAKLKLSESAVQRAVVLLDQGAPVPFIARYRIEDTGGMNENSVARIAEMLKRNRELLSRQSAILQSIDEQGSLTEDLHKKIIATNTRTDFEDLYLPYKPKPATRAIKAIESGLVGLAKMIWEQQSSEQTLAEITAPFISEEKGILTEQDAWQGARDICAERISMLPDLRQALREMMLQKGRIACLVADNLEEKKARQYKDYSGYSESVRNIAIHRILALRQGEKEGALEIRVMVDREEALAVVRKRILKNLESPFLDHLESSLEDACDRLLLPVMEGEVKNFLRDDAEDAAIQCIAKGVYMQLMAPAFGSKIVMSFAADSDSGCAVAVVGADGSLVHKDKLDIADPEKTSETKQKIEQIIADFKPEGVAIGRSAAGRAAHALIRGMITEGKINGQLSFSRISEHEAGFYSSSSISTEELPEENQTWRRVVSVGRRMQDPLRELAKVDPCCINVSPLHRGLVRSLLIEVLERVFTSCVSNIRVDVNKADRRLLSYVPGIGHLRAGNLTRFREEKEALRTRSELHQVRGMTPESFSACSPFLYIYDGENPLDKTGIHPERYKLVEKMAEALETEVAGLLADPAKRKTLKISDYIDEDTSEATLRFILDEMNDFTSDARGSFVESPCSPDVQSIENLKKGMLLEGVVTSVTEFGAFVDIGIQQDGLVHLSQLTHKRLANPFSVVLIGERVKVVVMDADVSRKRISLSIKEAFLGAQRRERPTGPPRDARQRSDTRSQGRPSEKREPRRQPPRGPARDQRNDGRGGGRGQRPDANRSRPPAPKKRPEKKGPSPYSPFAALKMVDGKIVIGDEKSEKK